MDLQGLRLTWYGHSTFRIETASGKHVVIDPWFKENPACPAFWFDSSFLFRPFGEQLVFITQTG